MVSKTLGYVLAGVGIAVTALGSIPGIREKVPIVPASISDLYVMGAGIVIVVLGIIILLKNPSSSQKISEVPIYHGKEVVGFRRLDKK